MFYAVAERPRTETDAETDAKAYSSAYFKGVEQSGSTITDNHKPYYKFNHLMSKLNFTVRLKEPSERAVYVDSICFSDVPCIMKLAVAARTATTPLTDGVSGVANPYLLNDNQFVEDKLDERFPELEGALGHFWLREQNDESISGQMEGGSYKYILTTEKKRIGDCIMIPPLYKAHSKSTLQLKVFLRDEEGNLFTTSTPIAVEAPATGWEKGKEYTINVALSTPAYYMDQTRGQIKEWDTETTEIDAIEAD